jgi:hypothetical protein
MLPTNQNLPRTPQPRKTKQNLREAIEGTGSPRSPLSPLSPLSVDSATTPTTAAAAAAAAYDGTSLLRRAQMSTFKPGSATILLASLQPRSARGRKSAVGGCDAGGGACGGSGSGSGSDVGSGSGSDSAGTGGGWRGETDASHLAAGRRRSQGSRLNGPPQAHSQSHHHHHHHETATAVITTSGAACSPAAVTASSAARFDLHITNLGDCGVRVVRGGQIILATVPQQHDFNLPYQMSHPRFVPETDRAEFADRYVCEVQEGDGES